MLTVYAPSVVTAPPVAVAEPVRYRKTAVPSGPVAPPADDRGTSVNVPLAVKVTIVFGPLVIEEPPVDVAVPVRYVRTTVPFAPVAPVEVSAAVNTKVSFAVNLTIV